MNYQETLELLYSRLPAFQNLGKKAIKPKLTNIIALCNHFGNPQDSFKSIHVAGTNGKGSSSHLLASILQESNLKVGLYTSPHLKDYAERFRINGQNASESYIIKFVEDNLDFIDQIKPSFFEVSVALAFKYFADNEVDIAVIEVGLGGRLDSTNIINPILSLITNIGYDHQDVLGDTLGKIAFEKAGIIKPKIPVVISEYHQETYQVFKNKAQECNSEYYFSDDYFETNLVSESLINLQLKSKDKKKDQYFEFNSQLLGNYQIKNINGVLTSIMVLNSLGFGISDANIKNGIENVVKNTNLKGRWQIIQHNPLIICDTGHNEHAYSQLLKKLSLVNPENIIFLLGFVKDKDVNNTIRLFPKESKYYFCTFSSSRALKNTDLTILGENFQNFIGVFDNVNLAIENISQQMNSKEILYIGGSTYLIAEINDL